MAEHSRHYIRAISCRKWVGTILLVVGLSSLLGGYFWWKYTRDTGGKGIYSVRKQEELPNVPHTDKEVRISDPSLTDEHLREFLQTHQLTGLRLIGCKNITASGLEGLEQSRGLIVTFGCTDTPLGDEISSILSSLDSIQELDLGRTSVHDLSDGVFVNNQQLRILSLSECHVTRQLLERCASHPSLKQLDLSSCSGIEPTDYSVLGLSRSLQIIDLTRTVVDMVALDSICSNVTLRVLIIHWILGVTPAQVGELKEKYPSVEIHYEAP